MENNQNPEASGSGDNSERQETSKKTTRSSPRLTRKLGDSIGRQLSSHDIPAKRSKVLVDGNEATIDLRNGDRVPTPCSSVNEEMPSTLVPKPLARSPLHPERDVVDNHTQNDVNEDMSASPSNVTYHVKWISHRGKDCPVVTQNQNGPCPLIAVTNVLLLEGKLVLGDDVDRITENELLSYVSDAISGTLPNDSRETNPNLLQNVQDAIALLPGLRTGLNVNIKFSGVKNFEYTPECLIFDTLRIPLYHGWLYDPQAIEIAHVVGNQSYNQLVETIIQKKSSENPDVVSEALVAENFLEATASQLTVHGLCELNASINSGQLGILFRNNHFIVLYKHQDILCQLVTDQGFLDEPDVVWETLSTISGDEVFLDGSFKNIIAKQNQSDPSEEQQISRDEELARQLHVEQQRMAASKSDSPSGEEPVPSTSRASSSQSHREEPPKIRDWKCTIS